MSQPAKPPHLSVVERAFSVYQTGSKAASWIFGAILLAFLIYVFLAVPHPTPAQCGLLRFLLSLTAGLFFLFFVGGLILQGQLLGFSVGAGGGAAIFFLMQFVVNPIPECSAKLSTGPEWNGGGNLGQLIETLRQQ